MNPNQIVDEASKKLQTAVDHFKSEVNKIRTGRAHPSMLDGVSVEAYGVSMPLNQVATISAPEAQLIQITPFDANNLQAIASAIRDNQTLGLNPVDDGRVVRVPIPSLTTERRTQLVKQLREKVEDSLISMRNARHEALKQAEQVKKDKAMTEDDYVSVEKRIDEALAKHKREVEDLAKVRETEIMTV